MGHDISAFHTKDKKMNKELVYLRRGCANEFNVEFIERFNKNNEL